MKIFKAFELFTEIIGWLQIVLSPTLFGISISFIIYSFFPNNYGLAAGGIIILIGIILGIILANNKFKKEGTISFLSKIDSTPDIDKWIQTEEENNKNNAELNKNGH